MVIHANTCDCFYCKARRGEYVKEFRDFFKINKRGTVTLYITFIITAILVITIAAFLVPTGIRLNSALYAAGDDIIADAQPDINSISDAATRTQLNDTLAAARAAATNNIQVNADIFRYSWILLLGLTALVVFLFTRRLVELNQGFV